MVNTKDEPADLSEIKKRAQIALNVHQRGDHRRALSLIEKSLSEFKRYGNLCGDLYRVQAAIYKNLAEKGTVRHNKKGYVKNAVKSGRRNKIRRITSGLKTSDANNRVPLQGISEEDRSSIASDGQTVLGSAPGEDLGQQLKEGAVIPTRKLPAPTRLVQKLKNWPEKTVMYSSNSESRNPAVDWIPDGHDQLLLHGTAEQDHHTDLENISALPVGDLDKQGVLSQLGEIQARRIPIEGDGRCLFRAMALGIALRNGEAATDDEDLLIDLADVLRHEVVEELLNRRKEHEWHIEKDDFLTYIEKLKSPTYWGGETEIIMACHVHKVAISVFSNGKIGYKNMMDYGVEYKEEGKAPIMLYYDGKNHYELLRTQS